MLPSCNSKSSKTLSKSTANFSMLKVGVDNVPHNIFKKIFQKFIKNFNEWTSFLCIAGT